MSSILKALKKLEDEKTSRFPDSLNIDSDILKSSHESRKMSPLAALLLLLLMFGGGAGAAYFIMKGNAKQPVTAAPQPITVVTATPSSPVAPQAAKPAAPSAAKPAVAKPVAAPVQKKPSAVTAQKALPKKAATVAAKPPGAKPSPARSTAQRSSDKALPAADTGSRSELPASAAVPTLRVNGIAFQNNSADSMAIINGIPVSNGSTVEGATVEEIKRDRVVFQRSGEKFEVKLGQANR